MIGPAEIEDILFDWLEARAHAADSRAEAAPVWPVAAMDRPVAGRHDGVRARVSPFEDSRLGDDAPGPSAGR